MKTLFAIALTVCCWGMYGPVLHWGQHDMATDGEYARLRPFICVGIAYFLIAVLAPGAYLLLKGEQGRWSVRGVFWSVAAGAAGAIGALGIILAFVFNGRPIFVMPLVFGSAPVVNSILTIAMGRAYRQVGPVFIAGLILVVVGAVSVMLFKPGAGEMGVEKMGSADFIKVIASILLVGVSWGSYGPLLHKGQARMKGSRLRPFMCVGAAYFAIAVIVPILWLAAQPENSSFENVTGTAWSLAAGAAGAVGALGVIMAFASGGSPVFVMPLIFGGAPVVNTFISMFTSASEAPGPLFYAGLLLVASGAAIVLMFAPRGHAPPPQPAVQT